MYRTFERPSICMALGCGLLAWLTWGGAQAQTIADYSRSQRAVLEADMAKNTAKAMGAGSNALAPNPSLQPPPAMSARLDSAAPPAAGNAPSGEKEMTLTGVIALAHRAMVELRNNGETHLLMRGDEVPGTGWQVDAIEADRVVLKAGKSRTRVLLLASGSR